MEKFFIVKVVETTERTLRIRANSEEEAKELARCSNNGDYLDEVESINFEQSNVQFSEPEEEVCKASYECDCGNCQLEEEELREECAFDTLDPRIDVSSDNAPNASFLTRKFQ